MRSFVILAEKANPFVKKGKPQPGDPGYKPAKTEGEDWQGQEEWQQPEGDPADPTLDQGLDETGGTPMADGQTPADAGQELPAADVHHMAQDANVPEAQIDPNADPTGDPVVDDPNADPAADDAAGQDPTADPTDPQAHAWAGDPVLDGSEQVTTPDQSYRAFSSPDGVTAWLDKADDGTLVGWVQDTDGTVYRYTDPDAWAVDVDDAAMQPSGGTNPPTADPAADPTAGTIPDGTPALPQPTPPGMPPQLQGKSHTLLLRRVTR